MPSKKKSNKGTEEKWGKSKARQQLHADIVDGIVTPEMAGRHVRLMRPMHEPWKPHRFTSNLRTLRDIVARDQKRMEIDFEAHEKGGAGC